jgi:hypothetical protein
MSVLTWLSRIPPLTPKLEKTLAELRKAGVETAGVSGEEAVKDELQEEEVVEEVAVQHRGANDRLISKPRRAQTSSDDVR